MQADVIYRSLVKDSNNSKAFIFSEATVPGIGRYAGYFSRALRPTWANLQTVIAEVLSFQLFGIPIVAIPTCGSEHQSLSSTTEDLCARWLQLSSVLPVLLHYENDFSTTTSNQTAKDRGPLPSFFTSEYEALFNDCLRFRYMLSHYIYTSFILEGSKGAVYKPVFFDFPSDASLLELDSQFLLGPALMFAAVLGDNRDTVEVYFPRRTRFAHLIRNETYYNEKGIKIEMTATIDEQIPAFIKEGHVVALLNVNDSNQSITQLKPEYSLFCHLSPLSPQEPFKLKAVGKLLAVTDLDSLDDSFFQSKRCADNCLLTVEVDAKFTPREEENSKIGLWTIEVNFIKGIGENFEKVHITGVRVIGLLNKAGELISTWKEVSFDRKEASWREGFRVEIEI
jgi:hypothetical protein